MQFQSSSHITIDELRQCPEFAHLDDDLAQKMIDTIQEFCAILASQYHNLESNSESGTTD